MRIRGWYIDGFGHFAQAFRDDLPKGLTVIYGPNEAGKSTLLAFIRYMLFGFPQGRTNEPQYKPQRGGNHGGRLLIEADGHGYTIERFAGAGGNTRVTREDGLTLQDADALVGVADRAVFQRVFAFGLDELRSFETLDHAAVRERIFSGSILGTGQSAQSVIKTLNDRRAALLAQRAKGPRINALLATLQEKRAQLARAQQEVQRYSDLRSQEETYAQEVEALARGLGEKASRIADLESLVAIWQDFYDARMADQALAGLEVIDAMPADASGRLSQATTAVEAAGAKVKDREAELARVRADHLAALDDPAGRAAADAVASTLEQRALAVEWADKAGAAKTRAQGHEAAIAAACATLGPDWDATKLAAYDRSIARVEEVRGLEAEVAAARTAQEQAAAKAIASAESAEAAKARVQTLTARLDGPAGATPESLGRRAQGIARLGGLILERAAQQVGLEADERACREAQAAAEESPDTGGQPAWLKPAFMALGAALAAFGAWRVAMGEVSGAAIILMAVAVAALPFLFASGSQAGGGNAKERLAQAKAAHGRRVERIQALAAETAQVAGELGLPAAPEGHDLERARQALARDEAAAAQRGQLEQELGDIRREWETLQARHTDDLARAKDAEARSTAAQAAWAAWKAQAGVPGHLSPQGAIDVFATIKQGQDEVRARDEALAEAGRYEAQVQGFVGQAAGVLRPLGQEAPANLLALHAALDAARTRCEAARVGEQQREHLARQLADLEAAVARERQALAEAEEHLSALLREAGARDVADFRHRLAVFDQRHQLKIRIAAASRTVDLRLGAGPRAEALRADLAAAEPDRWPREAEALQLELADLTAQRDQAIERRRDAELARQALEKATDIPALEAEIETLRAGIAAAVREWRVLTMAASLVTGTLTRFERDRQPAVLARAATLFNEVSEGVYSRLRQHDGGIVVVDRLEGEREAEVLSRGTREQLYLCVRMGLCREFASHSTSLPLVMDDVLVNFDADRAAAVGRLLLEVAKEQQILLFTCQPHTRDLLRSLDAAVHVVELPRYAGAPAPAPVKLSGGTREASRVVGVAEAVSDGALSATATALLEAIGAAGEPVNKTRALADAQVAEGDWQRAIGELTERRLVVTQGQGRGTRYTLPDVAVMADPQPTPVEVS